MIDAKIVADSVGPNGVRITTFKITFPRFILPEFNTHRMLSKNASSSRAIPVSKSIEIVKNTPFIPAAFNKNAKGMQGGDVMSSEEQSKAATEWLKARDAAVASAEQFLSMGVSKQYANRVLEPFSWATVVVTATEWANFFALRCHYMAQPEICELAMQMLAAFQNSTPQPLTAGQWHLPFIKQEDHDEVWDENMDHMQINGTPIYDNAEVAIKRSVARCARVSYLNHDGKKSTIQEDLALYDRLLGSAPVHASPAEHQAMARNIVEDCFANRGFTDKQYSGNLRGWIQYRKTLTGENVTEFTGPILKP